MRVDDELKNIYLKITTRLNGPLAPCYIP